MTTSATWAGEASVTDVHVAAPRTAGPGVCTAVDNNRSPNEVCDIYVSSQSLMTQGCVIQRYVITDISAYMSLMNTEFLDLKNKD